MRCWDPSPLVRGYFAPGINVGTFERVKSAPAMPTQRRVLQEASKDRTTFLPLVTVDRIFEFVPVDQFPAIHSPSKPSALGTAPAAVCAIFLA